MPLPRQSVRPPPLPLPRSVPRSWLARKLLQKLLLSLISNAAKAAPGGQVALTLTTRRDRALITLSDSGAPEERDLDALSPDSQAYDQIPSPEDGAGMGLSIARLIVRAHAGHIEVQSKLGGGSRFHILLPR